MDALSPERAEARALLLLRRLPRLGDRRVRRLVERFGTGGAALAAPEAAFAAALAEGENAVPAGGRAAARARGSRADADAVDALLARADAGGIVVAPQGAPTYPERLLELADPPPVLFLRGRMELLDLPAVAVVGSRRATAYGRRTAARLAAAVARHGVAVVSGLALGVDGEAHRSALEAGGATLAVLGGGADVVHPGAHRRLFHAIARRGLLVSEFPPGVRPAPHHFPRRNRVMAALARVVVVVEAAQRSGALITARHALDLGREVQAVPGPVDVPTSAGTNALIRDGARPALAPADVLDALGLLAPAPRPDRPPDGTDAAALWASLGARPVGLDELTAQTGLPVRRALAALSLLEVEGWAVQSDGARFARSP